MMPCFGYPFNDNQTTDKLNMKKNYKYNSLLLLMLLLMTISCDKQEPGFYDGAYNGAYFDYENTEDFSASINFADYILGYPESLPIEVSMKLLGYIADEERKVSFGTKPVEGYPEAEVILPEASFSNGEYAKKFVFSILRPEERDTEYAICIYIDSDANGGLGTGLEGHCEFTIFVKEQYVQPAGWGDSDWAAGYLGTWSPEKHIFFVNLLQDNNFAAPVKIGDWYTLVDYNQKAVAEVRRLRDEGSDEILFEIPFNKDCSYDKPSYWGAEHEKYIGEYTATRFGDIASVVGANTANELALLADENNLPELNKTAVLTMMKNYNQYFSSWGLSVSEFHNSCWYPMFEDIEYDIVQPDCWKSQGVGFGDKPNKYYGKYSADKYRFMIKTWLKKQNAEQKQFMLWQMFPLIVDWNMWDAVWDESAGGEKAMIECYKTFKAAYDAEPAGTYNFTFPEITID